MEIESNFLFLVNRHRPPSKHTNSLSQRAARLRIASVICCLIGNSHQACIMYLFKTVEKNSPNPKNIDRITTKIEKFSPPVLHSMRCRVDH